MMQPVMEAFGEIDKKLGEERKALDAAYSGTIELSRAQMWSLNYDLSFAPENPRIQPEEENSPTGYSFTSNQERRRKSKPLERNGKRFTRART